MDSCLTIDIELDELTAEDIRRRKKLSIMHMSCVMTKSGTSAKLFSHMFLRLRLYTQNTVFE